MSNLSRRRFLTIAGCTVLAGSSRHDPLPRVTWQGRAFGGDIRMVLDGPAHITRPALARAQLEIEAFESRFSLFRPDSDLARLNATGQLRELDPHWQALLAQSDALFHATRGLFDPTVQALWKAHAEGSNPDTACTGWDKLRLPGPDHRDLTLGTGQALTFNGIAQGAATDAVRDILRRAGIKQVLIDIGETATLGGPWRLGIEDPRHGRVAHLRLDNAALAVSSPSALQISPEAQHILDPKSNRTPQWSSVGVVATSAALADGLSTAGCLMSKPELAACATRLGGVKKIILVAPDGTTQYVVI